jgi:bifunctional enzyme CysN/CysC
MKWCACQPLLSMLEGLKTEIKKMENFSMPVQMVLRPNLDFRGFCGKVSSGSLNCGEKIVVADSGEKAQVSDILIGDAKTESCKYKDAVTLVLDKEIDISRGQTVFKKQSEINFGKLFNANVIWFDQSNGSKNRPYLLKIGSKKVNAKILKVKSMIDINSYERRPESSIQMNDIFECEISLDDKTAFASYKDVPDLGSFILIDKVSNLTVGGGVINHSLRRDENIRWQDSDVTIKQRNLLLGSEAKVLWLTGLSGSGKSTIANLVEKKLHAEGVLTYILDGDNLRHGLNVDLGFTKNDRIENLRRSGEVSKILHDAGVTVIASFISPFTKDREQIKSLFKEGDFFEVYVKADIETIKQRDPKGLYKKALNNEIPNFTGINDAYEEPINPHLIIDTTKLSPEEAVNQICSMIGLN